MRKALVRLTLWLCRVLDVDPVKQARLKASPDAVERAMRWDAFYREEGGLADMIAGLRIEAFEAAAELDPADTAKIYYWATADRNLRRLEGKVRAIVATGRLAQDHAEAAERMAVLRVAKSI